MNNEKNEDIVVEDNDAINDKQNDASNETECLSNPVKASRESIFDTLQDEIMQSDLTESEKNKRLSILLKASSRKVNLMLVGATGSGKSSTINALFDMSVA